MNLFEGITFDWIVSIAGLAYLFQLEWMAFRVAKGASGNGNGHRPLLIGTGFLLICTLVAAVGMLLTGPFHVGSNSAVQAMAVMVLLIGGVILRSWAASLGTWLRQRRGGAPIA